MSLLKDPNNGGKCNPFFSPSVLANDTVLGEPLFSVPMTLTPEGFENLPREARSRIPHLCFQIHGQPDKHFNFLSDSCTSVNALYSALPSEYLAGLHVITRMGISTVNLAGQCVFVEVGIENGCVPIVRGSFMAGEGGLDVTTMYAVEGVSVRKRRNRVRVSLPNCGKQQLVMHFSCGSGGGGDMPMIRFDITRGINLSPTSHGLIGESANCV